MTTCNSKFTNSSILNLQCTNTHICDFEISLKGFRSPSVVDLVVATSTTPDLEFLQRILLVEDLRKLWLQKPQIYNQRHKMHSSLLYILEKMDHDLSFKQTSYGLFMFVDVLLTCDFRSIKRNRTIIKCNRIAIERIGLYLTFSLLNLSYFVLDLKVHHFNSMRLNFCHGFPTLQTQILTVWICAKKILLFNIIY